MTTTYDVCAMPTKSKSIWLVDTSAAVALVMQSHDAHERTFAALADRRLGLAGHAAFETLSVLTRMPTANRLGSGAALRVVRENFPESRFLSPSGADSLLTELTQGRISGGAIYDALVGAVAREHGLPLVTRDRRALDTYRYLGAEVEELE